jgi:hypothetical protein
MRDHRALGDIGQRGWRAEACTAPESLYGKDFLRISAQGPERRENALEHVA